MSRIEELKEQFYDKCDERYITEEEIDVILEDITPNADNIIYKDGTVADALDGLEETTNNLPSAGTKLVETLPAGETTVTFTSDEITSDMKLNAIYTSIFGVQLESASVEDGSLVLTFDVQEEDMTVMALINATVSGDGETNLGDIDADEVAVDDTNLGLGVTNVQGALEGLATKVDSNATNISNLETTVNSLISSGTTDLTAGTSTLASGTIYCVYE